MAVSFGFLERSPQSMSDFWTTYEFRLVDHWREDELWTADCFVECSSMELRLKGRGGVIRGGEGIWG